MSIQIIKAGLIDTLQDGGRVGFRHLGVNTNGPMDKMAFYIANLILGNKQSATILEMSFPASTLLFLTDSCIAICGADFRPEINGEQLPHDQPVFVKKDSILKFMHVEKGRWCYLAVKNGFEADEWLGSTSTNIKIKNGGYHGGNLQKDNIVKTNQPAYQLHWKEKQKFFSKGWQATLPPDEYAEDEILFLPGPEWHLLTPASQNDFLKQTFQIGTNSDKMAYQVKGATLYTSQQNEMLSDAVNFGTVQLLPSGEMIILMADHQTTGGYPRIAQVITAHHSKLAQMPLGFKFRFVICDQKKAEQKWKNMYQHILQVGEAADFKWKDG